MTFAEMTTPIRGRVFQKSCLDMSEIPDGVVQSCITSPPYWQLRKYTGDPGMIGLEPTIDEYLANIVAVFREVRRVLRPDGTVWLNLGDKFWGDSPVGDNSGEVFRRTWDPKDSAGAGGSRRSAARVGDLKPKDLIGLPWMLAFALRADGWWLRQEIIWDKGGAALPESVTDRCTRSHETVFMLTKSRRYFYDGDAIREPLSEASITRLSQPNFANQKGGDKDYGPDSNRSSRRTLDNLKIAQNSWEARKARGEPSRHGQAGHGQAGHGDAGPFATDWRGANKRDVWQVAPKGFPGDHPATFPPDLIRPCVLAGTSAGGACGACGTPWERVAEDGDENPADRATKAGFEPVCECGAESVPCLVLDQFMGAGTTALVAAECGRDFTGYEISEKYLAIARERLGFFGLNF